MGYLLKSPFSSQRIVSIKVPKKKGKHKPRRSFDAEELTTFFGSAAFNSEQVFRRGGEWWLPIVALYTGARQAELIWLKTSDLRREDKLGVDYLNIESSEERGLKSEPSFRDVPLHPDLMRLGFTEYVAACIKRKEVYLFSDVCLRKTKRPPQEAYSKRFATLMDNAGLPDPRLVFHSFRHTFVTVARDAKISKDTRASMTGHVDGEDDDVHDTYGHVRLKLKAEAIAKMDFELDWDTLLKLFA